MLNGSIVTALTMTVLVILYTFLIMELADRIFDKPRLNRMQRIIIGMINSTLLWIALEFSVTKLPFIYTLIIAVLFVELYIFYNDSYKKIYFIASSFVFHIMAIHSIFVSIFAWKKGISCLEVLSSITYIPNIVNKLIAILVIVLIVLIKITPIQKVRIVSSHKEQLFFINLWLTVFNLYFIINARVYMMSLFHGFTFETQVITPIVIMVGYYIFLYFSYSMTNLLEYKSENTRLIEGFYKEQQYREAFVSEAIVTFESNFTRKTIVKGFENFKEQYADKIYNYNFMQKEILQRFVFKDDIKKVNKVTKPEEVIKLFSEGRTEITADYRRLKQDEEYGWVRLVTHLYVDRFSGDIMGFTYVKDIDQEKQHQLSLVERAERDSLTELYNKGTAELKITSYLDSDTDKRNEGVLFIIDVDNFKSINDHLGHAKGDEVLCELSNRLNKLFRSDDVVGRIGGDEFIVYMKRSCDREVIEEKAHEICQNFNRKYTSSFGVSYGVSASVGIALYPTHGNSFEDLYKMADIALYNSKNRGKNTYHIYEGESFSGYESNSTAIDELSEKSNKFFKDNRIGYVFEALYHAQTKDIKFVINDVLELLTKHYNYSRGYIFETAKDGKTTSNTFEWCNQGITPEIESLQGVPIEAVETSTKSFLKSGRFIMKSLDMLPELDRSVLEPQGIKSMLQFAIFDSGELKGFVGFDDCIAERHPSDQEVEELETICNIIAIFLIKHRIQEKLDLNNE